MYYDTDLVPAKRKSVLLSWIRICYWGVYMSLLIGNVKGGYCFPFAHL